MSEDLLTHKELSDYRQAVSEFGDVLQAHGRAAMELTDVFMLMTQLGAMRTQKHKKVLQITARIAKSRGRSPDDIKDIDRERAVIVWRPAD